MKRQTIEFELPEKVTTNKIYSGTHWTKRKRLKDDYLSALYGLKALIPVDKCTLGFYFEFKNRPLDCSNCSYMVKLIEDCLVHYEILKDDTIKHVQRIAITSKKGVKDKVRIEIEGVIC